MLQSIRVFKDVRNFREIFERLTWEMLECIAMVPLIAFCLMPVLHFCLNLLPESFWYYTDIGSIVYHFCTPVSACVFLLFLGKVIITPSELRMYSRQNRITVCCFLLFCLLMVISTCVNGFTDYALHGMYPRGESLFTYLSYYFVYFFPAACIRTPKHKRQIMHLLTVISLILALLVLVDAFLFELTPFRDFWPGRFAGGFYNPNHYGYYMTVALLLNGGLLVWEPARVWRIIALCSFLVQTAVLQFNNTLGALLGVILGLLMLQIMYRIIYRRISGRGIAVLSGFIVFSAIVGFFSSDMFKSLLEFGFDLSRLFQHKDSEGTGGSGRICLWRYTLKRIAEKPLLGHGVEGISDDMLRDVQVNRSHNEYLQYAAFFGIPAALCYIVGVFCVYLSGLLQKARMNPETLIALTAAFGYLMSAGVGNTLFYTAPYFFIVLGLSFTLPHPAEESK